MAAKRDGRRTSHESADGSNMLRSNEMLYSVVVGGERLRTEDGLLRWEKACRVLLCARRVATVCFCAGGGLEKRDGRWGDEAQTRI